MMSGGMQLTGYSVVSDAAIAAATAVIAYPVLKKLTEHIVCIFRSRVEDEGEPPQPENQFPWL